MIELHVTYTMKPGIPPKAFYDALNAANIPETCRQEKGNIRYHYFLPVDNDNQLFLLEIWEDKDSLKAHQQTPHFKAMPAISVCQDRSNNFFCHFLYGRILFFFIQHNRSSFCQKRMHIKWYISSYRIK